MDAARRTPLLCLALLALAVGARAAEPDVDADVEPQVLRATVTWPRPNSAYYRVDGRAAQVRAFVPPGPDGYPRVVDGEILPPKLYKVEERYTAADQDRLKQALRAAKRYADVNNALADGYQFEDKYEPGMGIHAHRLDLIFDGSLDLSRPQFLTYSLDKNSGRWQLIQVGVIHRGLTRPKLFDTPDAKGHFHDENICVASVGAQLATRFASVKCDAPGERRIGPIWMEHVAVNVYNDQGMFADEFTYADHVSDAGESYSFFGKKWKGGTP